MRWDGMQTAATSSEDLIRQAARSTSPTAPPARPTEYHWIAVFSDGREPITGLHPSQQFADIRDECAMLLAGPTQPFVGVSAIHILDANGHLVCTKVPST